jgi:hypothetical protein
MALTCLRSLRLALPPATPIHIHDDGSLTPEDFAELTSAIANSVAVPRKTVEETVQAKLERYPQCQKYRREHAFSCKLLDIPLTAKGDGLFYCDSDILFLKKPRRWFATDGRPVFAFDPTDGYSGSLWKIRYLMGLKLPSQVNAGIFHMPMNLFDLDFLEWFLAQPNARAIPWLVEQTAWAGLSRNTPVWLFDPAELLNAPPADADAERSAVAIHFMTPIRQHLSHFAATVENLSALPESDGFRWVASDRLGLRRILARPLKRWIGKVVRST